MSNRDDDQDVAIANANANATSASATATRANATANSTAARVQDLDSRITTEAEQPAQGTASGGGGQWMRIFVPNDGKQGSLLHMGKPGPGGVGFMGVSLQAETEVAIGAGKNGLFKTGEQLALHSGHSMNLIADHDLNLLAKGGMNLNSVGGLMISSIGSAAGLDADAVPNGGDQIPLPLATLQFMQQRNNVYNAIKNAQNFTVAFAGTVMGVKALMGFSWEPSWMGLLKFTQVCNTFAAVGNATSAWIKYGKGDSTLAQAPPPAPAPAPAGGAGAGGGGAAGAATPGGTAAGGGAVASKSTGPSAKDVAKEASLGTAVGKIAGKWRSNNASVEARHDMRTGSTVSDADVAAKLKTMPVTDEESTAARSQLTRTDIATQIPTDAEVAAAGGDYREAQTKKAADVKARDLKLRSDADTASSTASSQQSALESEREANNRRIDAITNRPMEEGPNGLGAQPMSQAELDEVQRLKTRNDAITEEHAAAKNAQTQADAERDYHASRTKAENWKKAGSAFEAGGAAIGAGLAVKGFIDAIKSGPKKSIPGVATVSDEDIFTGTPKAVTTVAGGGVTFVVPAVLSGFSVISGGSIGFQSGLKSEIFSLQSVTVEGGLGADLVAAGPVQVMSRMRDTSVMGKEIKIGAQAGDIATFAGKINTFMMKGWNPAKQLPTMEVTVKAEKAGKIQVLIDAKKRVFIEPTKVTIEFMGNSIVMTEKEIKIVGADKITMECKNMAINATESFKVTSPKIDMEGSSHVNLKSGGSTFKATSSSIAMDSTKVTVNKETLT